MTFDALNLDETFAENLSRLNISQPTAIQKWAIPQITMKRNCLITSSNGSGKTLVFLLPIVNALLKDPKVLGNETPHPQAVIITPTHELAVQTTDIIASLVHNTRIKFHYVGSKVTL